MSGLGSLLLAMGVGAGVLAALLQLAPPAAARPRLARVLLALHVAGGAGSAALMLLFFLVTDVRFAYVWDHTHLAYPLAYKVAGLWGGQEGTLLLWGGLLAFLAFVVHRQGGDAAASRADRTGGRLDRVASAFLALLASAILGLALAGDAFRRTDSASLAGAPDGAGLADVLVTPLMVIHPPLQFAAYALLAVPAAYALARWALPHHEGEAWFDRAIAWARPAWLLATVGLGLGALWAYYVLSFGGYWAWDPVETSNLLPWLALTGFLHAGRQRAQGGELPLAAPLLAVAAQMLVLFATFATRSGLWVSVHAFTDPTNRFEPDAAARLMGILGVHLPTRAFLAMLTVALLVAVALMLLHHAASLGRGLGAYARAHAVVAFGLAGFAAMDVRAFYGLLFEAARATGFGATTGTTLLVGALIGLPPLVLYLARETPATPLRLDLRRALAAAVALLSLATVVAFLLNLQVVNGQDRSLFDARAPLVALPIVVTLAVGLALAPLGRMRALLVAGGGLAAGVAGFFLFPDARVVALATPPLLAAGVATLLHLVHAQGRDAAPRPLRLVGVLTLASSLLALVFWANPPSVLLGLRVPDALAIPLGLVGYALATLGLLGALSAFRARDAGLARLGAGAAALAAGYGLGALLGLAALGLLSRHGGAFGTGAAVARGRFAQRLGALARAEAPRLRLMGVHLIHFALVVGLLGYAASTYSQDGRTFAAIAPGASVDLDDVVIRLGEGEVVTGEDGRVDVLRHPVTVTREGRTLAQGVFELRWEGVPNPTYKAILDVERGLARDVYLQPLAFHTPASGWVSEGETQRLAAAEVDAVTFRVTMLPMMTPVWACLWMMGLGMTLVLVALRLAPPDSRTPARRVAVGAGPAEATHGTQVRLPSEQP